MEIVSIDIESLLVCTLFGNPTPLINAFVAKTLLGGIV